jgi:short-subunit dehydrogenase
MAIYSGSKAYVSTFLEGLRVDVRSTGVKITDVRPGFVRTPMADVIGEADKLPFLMELDEAVETVWAGICSDRPVVEFPWQLVAVLRSSRLLPLALYDPAIRKIL